MTHVTFRYDNFRGGFCLKLGPYVRERPPEALSSLFWIFSNGSGQIAAIDSYWAPGGLPLREIHQARECPQGQFLITKDEFRVGKLLLRQSSEKLQLWFSTEDDVPRKHWFRQDVIWFSPRMAKAAWRVECNLVAGIEVDFDRTVATYPVSSLRISPEDFK